ncbi:transient receptor potential cation channel subfamily M member 2-like [Saccostrea echinata]|uniref:transient receptor potential cation channel subfamily M member 2-like n=1 Tax=Saccostrea echinata TaxID=191078 RepID=UPI002A7F1EF4|nr:transient receptor potential cation channel subfamily M member 2-like [Saccostrea echinata]
MITYTSGMLTKLGEGTCYLNASKVLLVIGFITVSIRILHMFSMSKLLGPKLVIIRKMFLDTFALMTIMFIITMCYNTSYHALLYSENSDFTFEQFEKITRNGYWMLFGELNLDDAKLTEPDCSFNQTEYREGSKERCPSSLGKAVAPYLKAVYVLIAVILLLNLLIAMYSHSFSKVHEKSKFYWSQLQTDFLEDFSIRSIFPVHMQLLAIPFFFIHACAWAVVSIPRYGTVKCCSSDDDDNDVGDDKDDISKLRHAPYSPDDDIKKLNKVPMFVRVFIYDSNYDLKLRKTRKTEGQAALSTKGEMDISEENKITEMSRKLIRHQKKIQKRINENIQKQIQMKLRPESIQKSNIEDNLGTSLSRRQRHPAIKIKQSLSYEYDSDSDVENESDT